MYIEAGRSQGRSWLRIACDLRRTPYSVQIKDFVAMIHGLGSDLGTVLEQSTSIRLFAVDHNG